MKLLIENINGENLIGHKGYHSFEIRDTATEKSFQVIIPLINNSINQSNPWFDKELYKFRHLIENLFTKMKHFRGVATRYNNLKRNYELALNTSLGQLCGPSHY